MIDFTHDCEMPALLPGVKPTGRKATIPFVVVVGFKDGRSRVRAHLLGPGLDAGADRLID